MPISVTATRVPGEARGYLLATCVSHPTAGSDRGVQPSARRRSSREPLAADARDGGRVLPCRSPRMRARTGSADCTRGRRGYEAAMSTAATPLADATAGYAPPGEDRPLAAYAGLTSAFGIALAAAIAALHAAGKQLPDRPRASDLLLAAVATHKVSRHLRRRDAFRRAPARVQGRRRPALTGAGANPGTTHCCQTASRQRS